MRSTFRIILKNKVFRLLTILILILLILQFFMATYSLSRTSSNSNFLNIHKKSITMLHLLLDYKNEVSKGYLFFDFDFYNIYASFTEKPLCRIQLSPGDISSYYAEDKEIEFRILNCISVKASKNEWLNYIIKLSYPKEKELLIISIITTIVIATIVVFCWILLKVIIPTRKLEYNVYELGMSLVEKEIRASGVKVLGRFANSINFIQKRLFKALNMRTKILSMITHDLKSPIARLKLRYELKCIKLC